MSKYNVKQICVAAVAACFYVTPDGQWLRMQFVEARRFCAMDEISGEEYYFHFKDMLDEDVDFRMLQRVVIEQRNEDPQQQLLDIPVV
jgi:hypothetical protein